MAAQPLNSTIQVFPTVRAFRQIHRHDSIAAIIKRLRPLVMSVPGEETMVVVKARDAGTSDLSPYMGEARHNAVRGFPIVIGLRDPVTFAEAQAGLADVDFAVQCGSDYFMRPVASALGGDLFADLAALQD